MTRPAPDLARPPLAPVPSLDELAAEPGKVATLPAAVVRDLYPAAARVEADLRARLFAGGDRAASTAAEERALGLEEAAKVLGMKPPTLYRKWRTLGIGYKDADGHVKFTRAALDRYLARRGGPRHAALVERCR